MEEISPLAKEGKKFAARARVIMQIVGRLEREREGRTAKNS
jgi:hypothetical protein